VNKFGVFITCLSKNIFILLYLFFSKKRIMLQDIKLHIADSIAVKSAILNIPAILSAIEQAAQQMIAAYRSGKKVLLAGNGGSAADAQHVAGELVARFYFDRPGLPAIALTTDTSVLTAIGNDYDYGNIFARQVQALGVDGDVFIGISTSGNSENILRTLKTCKDKGIFTIGLTSAGGGKMSAMCDLCIAVPSKDTPRIQEAHLCIEHILCYLVEQAMFSKSAS
jgi:D-sedoheptulose 7-phosphate isomerase